MIGVDLGGIVGKSGAIPAHTAHRQLNMSIADGLLELTAALEKSMQRDLDQIKRIDELLKEIDDLRSESDQLLTADD